MSEQFPHLGSDWYDVIGRAERDGQTTWAAMGGAAKALFSAITDRAELLVALERALADLERAEVALGEVDLLHQRYMELIMAVVTKAEGETRHQTALRYIQEAETKDGEAQMEDQPR